MKRVLIFALFLIGFFTPNLTQAQVGIGTSQPDSSALLELYSDSLGFLMPRMTQSQRASISEPAAGLLVYQTDGSQGFYYYTGSQWECLATCSSSTGESPYEWDLGWTPGPDGDTMTTDTMVMGSSESNPMFFGAAHVLSGMLDPGRMNTALGPQSIRALYQPQSKENVFIGDSCAKNGIRLSQSVMLGKNTGGKLKYGMKNICIGNGAGMDMDSVYNSTALGFGAQVTNHNTMRFGNNEVKRWGFGVMPDTNKAIVVGQDGQNGNGAYLSMGGAWTNGSSRTFKHDIHKINSHQILQQLNQLPVYSWKYNGGNETHIGPMAEDFYQIFHTGLDSMHLSTIDPAGVAIAGVKALMEKQEQLEKTLQMMTLLMADQQSEIQKLKKELAQKTDIGIRKD